MFRYPKTASAILSVLFTVSAYAREPVDVMAQAGVLLPDFSARLKATLVKQLPADLVFEQKQNWGQQAHVLSVQGVTPIKVLRNHGDWEKARVVAQSVPSHLELRADTVLVTAVPNQFIFNVHVTIPATVALHKQVWQNGVEVFGSRLHARLELAGDLQVQAEFAKGAGDKINFDQIDKLAIVGGTVSTGHFVVDKVDGVGGSFASWTGGTVQQFFKPWQPAVLSEVQKTMGGAMDAVCKSPETCADICKIASQLETARVKIAQGPPSTPQQIHPVSASEVVRETPPPSVSFTIDDLLFERQGRSESHRRPAESTREQDKWGLAEHAVNIVAHVISSAAKHATPPLSKEHHAK